MHIIPVIDVKGGIAVAARGGERASYQPLQTPLARSADPLEVARGYLALHPFRTFYVADLDGITHGRADWALVARLSAALPGAELWVDNGACDAAAVATLLATPRTVAVIGSECGIGSADVQRLALTHGRRVALSLDFKGETFLGARELLRERSAWPQRVIAMTLASVGVAQGPDLERIGSIAAMAGLREVYAAGGIRHRADLEAARSHGAAGALVATALHSGQIKTGDLEEIAG